MNTSVRLPGFRRTRRGLSRAALVGLVVVSLTGWLQVIWNGEPRFMLIDDRGAATRVLIDPVLARPFGGPRALNQKRVTITGEPAPDQPETVRALSIELTTESR